MDGKNHKAIGVVMLLFCFFFAVPVVGGNVVHSEKFVDKDVEVAFAIERAADGEIREGEFITVQFKVKDISTGSPIGSLRPAVWLDLEKGRRTEATGPSLTCKDKIGLYLQGSMAYRPDLDLNSYYILALNNDATISVTDPIVSLAGITQLFTMVYLKRPGEDWILSGDEKRLFVTMPKADAVAVVDTETFKVVRDVQSGPVPFRIALQPDGRYLWVGNNAQEEGEGGVTVIDSEKLEVAARILTGSGHHEIAFTDDSLFAFVTNEKDGTLSVIDIQKLTKVKDLKTGPGPIAMVYSGLSKSVYVANALDGNVVVVDGKTHAVVDRIRLKPGLRAIRFSPGDRWGFVVNYRENVVHIFDASDNRVLHTVEVGKEPDQIAFTKDYAYVRSRGTELISLIGLAGIDREGSLTVVKVPVGQSPPGSSPFHAVADAVVPTPETGHALIANPADRMIYYYMEGMNYAMGSFRSYGGTVPKAVRVVDRSLREREPGVYSARVRIPAAGKYQAAFLLDAPRVIHCFEFTAKENPRLASKARALPQLEFLNKERRVSVEENFSLQFKLTDPRKNEPIVGLKDVVVQVTLAPGTRSERQVAKDRGDGVYEVSFTPRESGAYYLSFSCPSLRMDFRQFPYFVLQATGEKP